MKIKLLLSFLLLSSTLCYSNNVQLGTPSLPSSTTIQFTIQWDNSWRMSVGSSNFDAVWVFVKYQSCADNLWKHVDLSSVAIDHSVTGSQLEVLSVSDSKGVYLRLNAVTTSTNINSATVTCKFSTLTDAGFNYQIFGTEMVNIPSGDFYVGDGTRGSGNFGFSDVNPYPAKLITSAIQTAGLGTASNYQQNTNYGSTTALPAAFPLGWNSFYCMKYEISQEQYASFLNTLTYEQQITRTANNPNSAVGTLAIAPATNCRNGIKIQTAGTPNNIPAVYGCDLNSNGVFNEAADGQNIACNWLSWPDLIAYLDWATLRPMTEFEFEKVCRGPSSTGVTANEYAWGSTFLIQASSSAITGSGANNESSTAFGVGLCAYGVGSTAQGPLRCGFAAGAATIRSQAGSSYYGVMDMSGNVMEQCLGGYNFNYSAFTSAVGDGSLTTIGLANTTGWPLTGGGQLGGVGRGGDWYNGNAAMLNISDRNGMTSNSNQGRDRSYGGRGVR
jgi:formylglycine-generating enzyme required for sulfatase activity